MKRVWPGCPRWLTAALCLLAFAGAFWRLPQPAAPAFRPVQPLTTPPLPALFAAQMLPTAGVIARTPSLTFLPDGRLAAAWTAGSAEDASDLAIYFSTLGREGWQEARAIVTRESAAGSLLAHVRRIGQALIHRDGETLHLWYIAVGVAGNAMLVHGRSTDGGRSWGATERLSTSPLASFGNGLGAPPLALADGGLGLPASHDLLAGHGEWLRLSAAGRILDKQRLPQTRRTRQPVIIASDARQAMALLSDDGPPPGQVRLAGTTDGGEHWTASAVVGPPSGGRPLAALRLASGRLLLAGNPQQGRDTLALWLSEDNGKSWQRARNIESASDGAADFSAPALQLGSDGRIHLAYAWRGRGIRYVTFSEAWLAGALQ